MQVKYHFNLVHTGMLYSYLNMIELPGVITAGLLILCDLRDGTLPLSQGSLLATAQLSCDLCAWLRAPFFSGVIPSLSSPKS